MTDPTLPRPLSRSDALFLDFDGTLAPIQADPFSVALPAHGASTLLGLAEALGGALAVLSGRDIRDLGGRIPHCLWRAGGHGLDICAPGEALPENDRSAPAPLLAALKPVIEGLPGVRLEPKGEVLAVHYRGAPQHADKLAGQLSRAVETVASYRLQHGKMVFELKPEHANKGHALERMMQDVPFCGRRPVMVGDDTTDEDAMRAALALGGVAVKVGDGETVAPFRLSDPAAVWNWLEEGLR